MSKNQNKIPPYTTKLVAFGQGADKKAKCTIKQAYNVGTIGGAKNCSQELAEAYERAKLIADKRNQGDLWKAKEILEAAGWEVYWGA